MASSSATASHKSSLLNIPKKFGAGVDKVDEAVQAFTSWEDGGCDEFFTFASDTEQGISSDGRDSGTRALVSALMWGDAGAKHAYVCNVVFLSEVNGRADSDDDFQDVGGGGGCGTRSSGRGGGGGGRGGVRQL